MSTPLLPPTDPPTEPPTEPEPQRSGLAIGSLVKGVGALLIVAVVSAGSAWAVFEYRIQAEQAATANQVSALRDEALAEVEALKGELAQRQVDLEAQVSRVEQAATEAGLLLQKDGQVTTLDARLKELDTLKLELQKTQQDLDSKLKAMEQSVLDQISKQGQETAQALSVEMRYKSLLIKAQGEVLLAQFHWAEGNRGLARDELAVAARSLQDALAAAPEAAKPPIKAVVDSAEASRSALILEQSTARDSLNLLWHQVSELLAPAPAAAQ